MNFSLLRETFCLPRNEDTSIRQTVFSACQGKQYSFLDKPIEVVNLKFLGYFRFPARRHHLHHICIACILVGGPSDNRTRPMANICSLRRYNCSIWSDVALHFLGGSVRFPSTNGGDSHFGWENDDANSEWYSRSAKFTHKICFRGVFDTLVVFEGECANAKHNFEWEEESQIWIIAYRYVTRAMHERF